MPEKSLTLSIVIPVYNEERYLPACLDSIKNQSEKPDEVIVVDNNSTDKSVEIAKSFSFVTAVHEKCQHQAFAQKTGFDKAAGDIVGRIDADSILPPDWVERVKKEFEHNSKLVALTGEPDPYDVYLKRIHIWIFDTYNNVGSRLAGVRLIWGANCALRRNAWQNISEKVLQRPDIWEDFDLAFCLKDYGKVKLIKNLRVGTSFRAAHQSIPHQVRYHIRSFRTFYLRTNWLRATLFVLTRLSAPLFLPISLADFYILQPLSRAKRRA